MGGSRKGGPSVGHPEVGGRRAERNPGDLCGWAALLLLTLRSLAALCLQQDQSTRTARKGVLQSVCLERQPGRPRWLKGKGSCEDFRQVLQQGGSGLSGGVCLCAAQ